MRRGRRFTLILVLTGTVAAAGIVGYGVYGLGEVATGQMGERQITLPNGKVVFVRRQSYAHTSEELYLSGDNDYCAPSRPRDLRLPHGVTGSSEAPMLVSFAGDALVIHTPSPFIQRRTERLPIQVVVISMPLDAYNEFAAHPEKPLPQGWQRIEVEWGHNTCSL